MTKRWHIGNRAELHVAMSRKTDRAVDKFVANGRVQEIASKIYVACIIQKTDEKNGRIDCRKADVDPVCRRCHRQRRSDGEPRGFAARCDCAPLMWEAGEVNGATLMLYRPDCARIWKDKDPSEHAIFTGDLEMFGERIRIQYRP